MPGTILREEWPRTAICVAAAQPSGLPAKTGAGRINLGEGAADFLQKLGLGESTWERGLGAGRINLGEGAGEGAGIPGGTLEGTGRSAGPLRQQHGVAVGVETVAVFYGGAVGRQHAISAGERGDQHQ